MRYTNIIHLSDLHLKDDGAGRYNQSQVIDALIDDLRDIRDSQLRPDLLIFSGDLAQSADDPEIYDELSVLLTDLASACGLSNDRVLILPGNHDISRSAVGAAIPTIKRFRELACSVDSLNGLYADQQAIRHIGNAFQSFSRLSDQYGGIYRVSSNAYLSEYSFKELNLAVICLNTAWLSGAGLTDDVADERRLAFPEMALGIALKRVPSGAQVVVVGHHPMQYLNETNEALLRSLLLKSADIYLSGHLHAANPFSIFAAQGTCALVQSGSLYASRDWWNGYSIVSTIPGQPHHRITLRKWHEERREFGVASELADSGVVYTTPGGKSYWSSVAPKIDLRVLESWRVKRLMPFLLEELSVRPVSDLQDNIFIAPEFERDVYAETETGLERLSKPESMEFAQAQAMDANVVIGAGQESGKTTLIRQWALDLGAQSVTAPNWRVPVVLRFGELKNHWRGIERLVRQKLPSLPAELSAYDLLGAGMVTIFVDDAELRASDKKAAFDAFAREYKSNRFILVTSNQYLQGAGIAPVVVDGLAFEHLRVKKLRTSQLLTLIERHGTTDPAQADRMLQRMVQEAASLNVPITPVTGTFLIQIYTEDSSKPLINRANLIERYVEISLEKFAPQDLLPGSFDFHNKADLLSYVSSRMCESETYDIEEAELISWISSYLKEFGLRFSSVDLLQYFVQARIFEKFGSLITFRLNAFMEYFAARRMASDASFKDYVLAEERYLSFSNEIAFYAAISRKDRAWLLELYRRFCDTSALVWKDAPQAVRDATLIETFAPPNANAAEGDVLAVEVDIFEAPLSESERRSVLDHDSPVSLCEDQRVRRSYISDPGEVWTAQLSLLSSMLKNMELVSNDLKEEVLTAVIHGWLQFTCVSMGLIPALARDKQLRFAGIDYIVLFPQSMEIGEVARRLFMYMPISTAKVACYYLGTEKLSLQLEGGFGKGDGALTAGQQFMRACLLAQMGVENIGEIMTKALTGISGHTYLSAVFVRQLSELAVRFRLPEAELQKIRLLAAEILTQQEGTAGWKAANRKSQIIKGLRSSRLRIGAATER